MTAAPAYQRIRGFILDRIQAGAWREGDLIPSEPELARRFRVARMTVNRAVRELAVERVLRRVRGAGTFVAEPPRRATLVHIRSIAAEIADRGGTHRAQVLELARHRAGQALAAEMGVTPGAAVFRSRIVHAQDGVPVQYEERWVNAALLPGYGAQDFRALTPNEYLTHEAPLERVEYRIEARAAPPAVRRALRLCASEPCLLLHRRTFSRGRIASAVDLWHPGSRWQFTGHF
ncbi:MAG TPA: histidine utilization repressor [Anaeromyxobacter sp.]|nr:histidine utilization repressor [Anaeromyxobacter sp.]